MHDPNTIGIKLAELLKTAMKVCVTSDHVYILVDKSESIERIKLKQTQGLNTAAYTGYYMSENFWLIHLCYGIYPFLFDSPMLWNLSALKLSFICSGSEGYQL